MTRTRRDRSAVVCQQLVELVTDYLEGALDPQQRAAVEQHLAACGHCTGYVEQVRRVLELTAAERPEPVPDALVELLTARYRRR